uniref:MULE transposase domain-containing protein n=1 Tax=Ditylenchus dipsaci TaxID=166011 RepID=A0A915EVW0_9BILA
MDKRVIRCNMILSPYLLQQMISDSRRGRNALPPPSLLQIKNFKYREQQDRILSIQDLQKYAEQHRVLPDDENEPYVISFDVTVINEEEHFCMTWTTTRLDNLQHDSALSSNEDKWGYEAFMKAIAGNGYKPKTMMGDGDRTISAGGRCR